MVACAENGHVERLGEDCRGKDELDEGLKTHFEEIRSELCELDVIGRKGNINKKKKKKIWELRYSFGRELKGGGVESALAYERISS